MNDQQPSLSGRLPASPRRLDDLEIRILFPEIFRACHRQLLATVFRITGDFHAAQEIAQDAFVKLNDHLHTHKVDHRIVAWLHQVARNAALDACRSSVRRPESTSLDVVPDVADLPGGSPSNREQSRLAERLLAKLPPNKRLIVELRARDGLGYAEIADLVGLTPDAVRMVFSRTCVELRQKLGDHCQEPASPTRQVNDDDDDLDFEGTPAPAT